MKALIELHFQHEALSRFIENVLRSTLSHPNETSKECIQFLNEARNHSPRPLSRTIFERHENYAPKNSSASLKLTIIISIVFINVKMQL
jgi:hypothetical protein